MIKKFSFISTSLLLLLIVFTACSNQTQKPVEETTIKTEIQEVPKDIDSMMEEKKDVKPIAQTMSTDELITNALLKHYIDQFGNTDAKYKTTGYKMYVVEDAGPKDKKAYGFANYMEYDYKDGKLENTAGSGPTGIAVTFSTDGKSSNVDYEILTDHDLSSEEFKKAFPKEVQEKILARKQEDIDEVTKKQEDMLAKLMAK